MTELPMDQAEPIAEAPRRRGRPRVRDQIREPQREARSGGVEVVGRNGEILSRKRKDNGIDQFDVPKRLWPDGWVYQWNTVSVTGNSDIVVPHSQKMYENGWRPVPASRHPDLFLLSDKNGSVIRDGMRLEERPKALNDEALAEMEQLARTQMRDRDEALMGQKANLRNSGIEMSDRYRGTGANVKITVDRAIDIPTPQHEIQK